MGGRGVAMCCAYCISLSHLLMLTGMEGRVGGGRGEDRREDEGRTRRRMNTKEYKDQVSADTEDLTRRVATLLYQ